MKHRSFDNYVKDRLSGSQPEVPAHIWENIVAEQNRKKPFMFGWFTGMNMAAALLVISAVSGTIYLASNRNTAEDKTAAVEKQKANPSSGQTNSTAPFAETNDQHNNGTDNTIANTNPNTDNAINAADPSKQSNRFYIPSRSVVNTVGSHAEKANDISGAGNDVYGANIGTAYNTTYAVNPNRFGLNMLSSGRTFNPSIKMPFMLKGLNIPCPEAERDAAGNKKYIEIYAGPDYAFNSLNDYNDGNYTQQRKESVHSMLSYSAGIRYTKVWGSGLSIRTGLNYSRINESFKQEKGHVTQNVYITNERGDTIGTSSVTGTQYRQNTNKLTTVDIPLVAGFELGNGRFHTNINAGVMINLISREKGLVLDKAGNAVDISSDAAPTVYQYKKNTGVSLTGGVSVYYKLNDRMHLMAEPYFRYGLSPVTKNELSLKQKYHTAGIRLGVRMDL